MSDNEIVLTLDDDFMEEMVIRTVASAYRVMTRMLLGKATQAEIDHVRGMARIGIETPPDDESATALHDDLMEVLKRLGLEPATSEEVETAITNAITDLMATRGSQGPTVVQ